MTRRVLWLAALLTPLNAYWIVKTEVVWAFVHATVLSLFFNVIGTLFWLVVANRLVGRVRPRSALAPGELLSLYILLCASTAVFGHDFLQILGQMLIYPYRQVAGDATWGSTFLSHLPRWLVVTDPVAIKGAWQGNATLYTPAILRAWAVPLVAWLCFMMALVWTMLCMTSLLRRRWTEHERLSFPLVQIPMTLICHTDRLFSSPGFWIAFTAAAGLDLWNAAATLWPSIPAISLKTDLLLYATQRPWSDMGWTPLVVYPFAVGLTYFMPLDLAFATWAFFWIWKAQMIARSWMGMDPLSGMYQGDQSSGAWLGIGMMALWGARKSIVGAFRSREAGDPMPERWAAYGTLAGLATLLAMMAAMGLSPVVGLGFLALLVVFLAAATRMRAEFGPATHDLYFSGPERVMTSLVGPGRFGTRDLTVLSQFHWITRDYRSSAMPHYLEGWRMGREAGLELRRLVVPILLISAWAYVTWFWCFAHEMYDRGAIVRVAHPGSGWTLLASEPYRRLEEWLTTTKRGPDINVWQQMGGGLLVTLGLFAIRQSFMRFPFHPVGYALAGSWTMSWLWFSVMVGWLLKLVLLRYGGVRMYRRAVPVFVGLVLGEFVAGGGLSLLNALTDRITFGFFP